ncbi:MAG: hypothetical protein WCO48_01605 [Candidatus Taylorbacteria bacterium]
MYTTITIFYVSLVGIIVLILLKRREVLTGERSIVSRLGEGSDHVFAAFFRGIRRGISYINKHTFIALAQWLAFHVLVHVRKVYVEIKHIWLQNIHTRKVLDMVRGKGEIRKHGVSFYLRRISGEEEKKK